MKLQAEGQQAAIMDLDVDLTEKPAMYLDEPTSVNKLDAHPLNRLLQLPDISSSATSSVPLPPPQGGGGTSNHCDSAQGHCSQEEVKIKSATVSQSH